jgi:photosystem II stability/assembly factor-like uncharacterized protein
MRRSESVTSTAAGLAAVVLAGCGGYGSGGASDEIVAMDRSVTETIVGPPTVEQQVSGTEALLIGVSPVDNQVAWVSGTGGTYLRTLDGGATWTAAVVPGADSLQFRDVHAASADEAWLMSAGPGDQSRIYHTSDAGATWTLQWTNPEADGFYDCLDFWDTERGVLYGDAVDGGLRIMRTDDGGATWTRVPEDALPAAGEGEGGFAASGTCFIAGASGRGWVSTGNADPSRVLTTSDYGRSWRAHHQPIRGGSGAGLFSVSFRNAEHGVVFGGSLNPDDEPGPRVAVSDDGGETWTLAGEPSFAGAIFGGSWVPGANPATMVAVAPTGADYSMDGGRTWVSMATEAYWGIGFASARAGWIVGPGGRIAKVGF